jgi:hypothetical protein
MAATTFQLTWPWPGPLFLIWWLTLHLSQKYSRHVGHPAWAREARARSFFVFALARQVLQLGRGIARKAVSNGQMLPVGGSFLQKLKMKDD